MSVQCAKCGTQIREGAKFCHACGLPVATTNLPPTMPFNTPASAPETTKVTSGPIPASPPKETANIVDRPSAPSAYFPQVPQTYHEKPMAVGTVKKSGNGLKVVLITLAIMLFLGAVSVVGAVYYISRKAQDIAATMKSGDGIKIETKDGDLTIGGDPFRKLGIPPYPDAKPSGFPAIAGTSKNDKKNSSGGFAIFTTEDDVDDVVEFYKNHYGSRAKINDVRNDEFRSVEFKIEENGFEKMIRVINDGKPNSETQIFIASGSKDQLPIDGNIPDQIKQAEKQAKDSAAQAMEKARQAKEQADRIRQQVESGENPPPPPPPPPRR